MKKQKPKSPIKIGEISARSARTKDGRFAKGNPGNVRGRGKGSRNRATVALQSLLEADGQRITRRAIELALSGDPVALRLTIERLIPPAKERLVSIDLPGSVETAAGVAQAVGKVLLSVASGEITPTEAEKIAAVLEQRRKALETQELEARIAALETKEAA